MAETPFLWGRGGRKLTPDQVERERESAALLAKGAMDYSPVQHWSQGLNRVAQGLLAGIDYRNADNADAEISSVNKGLVESLLGGGSSAAAPVSSSAIPMTSAAGEVSATAPGSATVSQSGVLPASFLGAVDTTEGAGGYDTLYGHAQRGKFSGTDVSAMPIRDVIAFTDPSGPYAQTVKSQIGRVATPVGRHQIVGTTLRNAVSDLGLDPNATFDAATQDRIALHLAKNRVASADTMGGKIAALRSEWHGFKGVPDEQMRQIVADIEQSPVNVASIAPQTATDAIEAVAPLQPIPEAGSMSYAGQEAAPPVSLSEEVAAYQQTPEYAAAFPGRVQPSQAAVANAMPVQVAGGGDRAPMANPGINQAIVQALTNPQATPQTQRLAAILMEQEQRRAMAQEEQRMQEADPMRQLQLEEQQLKVNSLRNPTPEFRQLTAEEITTRGLDPKKQYQIGRDNKVSQIGDSGTTVTVNNGEGDKFYENLDKKNAEMFSALSEAGVSGRSKISQINRLETILSNAPQGGIAALKQAAGEYGINTEGLSDIQAAQALINELVPQQRQPGSGPMSDADLALFKQSLPRIINQPGGNETIVNTMRGITEYQVRMGEIADAVADRSMTPTQGREAIRNLKNPLDDYTKLIRGIENDEQDQGWREISPGVRVRKID